VVYRFEPWLVSGNRELLSVFFEGLLGELDASGLDSKKLREALQDFATAVGLVALPVTLVDPVWGSVLRAASLLTNRAAARRTEGPAAVSSPFGSHRERLVKELEGFGRRIVVTVDDLDRLDPEALLEVLRMLHALSSLPYFVFLVAADDESVADALETRLGPASRNYLDKLVNVPYALPRYAGWELREMFFEMLRDVTQRDPERARFEHFWELGYSRMFSSPRDLKRIASCVRLKWHGEVEEHGDALDLALLEGLRVLDPAFHRTLSERTEWCVPRRELERFAEPDGVSLRARVPLSELSEAATAALAVLFPHALSSWVDGDRWAFISTRSPTCRESHWLYFDAKATPGAFTASKGHSAVDLLRSGWGEELARLHSELDHDGRVDLLSFLSTCPSLSDVDPAAIWSLLRAEFAALAEDWRAASSKSERRAQLVPVGLLRDVVVEWRTQSGTPDTTSLDDAFGSFCLGEWSEEPAGALGALLKEEPLGLGADPDRLHALFIVCWHLVENRDRGFFDVAKPHWVGPELGLAARLVYLVAGLCGVVESDDLGWEKHIEQLPRDFAESISHKLERPTTQQASTSSKAQNEVLVEGIKRSSEQLDGVYRELKSLVQEFHAMYSSPAIVMTRNRLRNLNSEPTDADRRLSELKRRARQASADAQQFVQKLPRLASTGDKEAEALGTVLWTARLLETLRNSIIDPEGLSGKLDDAYKVLTSFHLNAERRRPTAEEVSIAEESIEQYAYDAQVEYARESTEET